MHNLPVYLDKEYQSHEAFFISRYSEKSPLLLPFLTSRVPKFLSGFQQTGTNIRTAYTE